MEWLRISTSTELVRVATDEIVYVRADGNYSDLVLTNGKSRKMTFQLHFFDEVFQQLQNNMFVRVGRSLIVNKRYIYVINLTEQQLILSGGDMIWRRHEGTYRILWSDQSRQPSERFR